MIVLVFLSRTSAARKPALKPPLLVSRATAKLTEPHPKLLLYFVDEQVGHLVAEVNLGVVGEGQDVHVLEIFGREKRLGYVV